MFSKGQNLFLEQILPSREFLLEMQTPNLKFKQILHTILRGMLSKEYEFNLTCTLWTNDTFNIDKPTDSYSNALSTHSILGFAFLIVCVTLVFLLFTGWTITISYRRFKENNMKKENQQALERSTQQILDRSPIIIFDSNSADNDFNDGNSTCAICLETFRDQDKIRKLGKYTNKFIQLLYK